MAVLERSELEASPLADLHAIADQIGLDGFRRLRKADLIDAILGEGGGEPSENGEERPRARRRRPTRLRRGREETAADDDASNEEAETREEAREEDSTDAPAPRARAARSRRKPRAKAEEDGEEKADGEEPQAEADEPEPARSRGGRSRGGRGGASRRAASDAEDEQRVASGVVEVLGNGSAFLRVDPPDPSDEDVYISAAQVRRCELVSGDRVSGPVRTPRRSERYASLVRIDTINDAPADSVSDGVRYDDLPVSWPSERLALGSQDPTLEAIEWLTPLGKGSRATIVGARYAGKSETLRRLLAALAGRERLELSLVLVGVRPEEIAQWREGPLEPACALTFAASPDAQAQAAERALDAAKRIAARGGDALVLIDSLDGLAPAAARRALAAARNLEDGGSLTVIATASQPLGGETTVIALDAALTSSGRQPILDLMASGTLRPELLVGEKDAEEIRKARAKALE
jgi:transcription termination factor Rho